MNFGKYFVSVTEIDDAKKDHTESKLNGRQNPGLDQVGCFT